MKCPAVVSFELGHLLEAKIVGKFKILDLTM